jgi:hypothetical protein
MSDDLVLPQSESLLTEILGLLQSLAQNMDEVRTEIQSINTEIKSIHDRIDHVISDGFPDGDLKVHRQFHVKGFIARLFA